MLIRFACARRARPPHCVTSFHPSPRTYSSKPAKPLPYSRRHREHHDHDTPHLNAFDKLLATLRTLTLNLIHRLWTDRSSHLKSILFWLPIGFFGGHFFWSHLYSINGCWGPSMLPTLHFEHDHVLISHLHRRGRWIQVGDMVSFDHPVRQGTSAIKRVVGMPGDFVLRDTPGESGVMVMVPMGHVWVAGDNVPWTRDSRHYGPLPMGLIRGKVLARVMPWRERRWFSGGLEERDVYDD